MHWQTNLPHLVIAIIQGQNPAGSGPSISFDADWTNALVALLALAFTIFTYVRQEQKNRAALEDQREKDRVAVQQQKEREQTAIREQSERDQAAKLELEQMRRQTIQLEWFQETVKRRMTLVYATFDELRNLRDQMRKPDLSETEKDDLIKAIRSAVRNLRNSFLEPIFFVHPATYNTLKSEMDELADKLSKAIFNDELKLSHDGVYEREIGVPIRDCQQRFFKTLYTYRGEE